MITLNVNGEPREYTGDGDMPLLWYLRDLLGLTGTKYSCGKGLCGACTVHLNGAAVRSCVVTMSAAAGAEVTTIEGLSPDGRHPLQIAWAEHDVPQCGYCQTGQIMQAASLLAANPALRDTRKARLRGDFEGEPSPVAVQIAGDGHFHIAQRQFFQVLGRHPTTVRHIRSAQPTLTLLLDIIAINISLVLAPASDCDPKLIFRATTVGLKSLSAKLLSAGIFLLSAQ